MPYEVSLAEWCSNPIFVLLGRLRKKTLSASGLNGRSAFLVAVIEHDLVIFYLDTFEIVCFG